MTAAQGPGPAEADVLDEIDALAAHLEALTTGGVTPDGEEVLGVEAAAYAAARAEVDWKVAQARFVILDARQDHPRGQASKDLREARALDAHADLFEDYRLAEAVLTGTKEGIRTTTSRLDAARTKAASYRGQV